MKLFTDIIGWIGSIVLLLAYGLNSYQKIKSDSIAYTVLNLIGGISLIIYSFYYSAYANTFVNIVWVLVAFFAWARWLGSGKGKSKNI